MATHLSKENIENYLERSLSHEELPQINEHLYGCEACYHQFLGLLEKRRFPIEIDLDELSGLKGWHIQGEDLKAYVEGRMDQLDLDYANLHIAECAWCREEVDKLFRVQHQDSVLSFKKACPAQTVHPLEQVLSLSPRCCLNTPDVGIGHHFLVGSGNKTFRGAGRKCIGVF